MNGNLEKLLKKAISFKKKVLDQSNSTECSEKSDKDDPQPRV